MKLKFFFLLFFSLCSIGIYAQKDKIEGKIIWTDDYRLTWDDFQGRAKKSHFASAMSDITFSIRVNSEGYKLYVFVQPYFDPKGSWVKDKEKSDYLLQHEQVHFDIYEVNARKFRRELQMKKLTSVNMESTVNKLIEKYTELNIKVQERYDTETDHSLKTEKQEKWNEKIALELEELSDYKEAEFSVSIKVK